MPEINHVYRCAICGNVVEIVGAGQGVLICCGQPMELLKENTVDAAKEKHVPVLFGDDGGVLVKVGAVPHPMEQDHYIEWIEVINGDYVNRKYLAPGAKPEAAFYVPTQKRQVVRAYCNKHGLWKA